MHSFFPAPHPRKTAKLSRRRASLSLSGTSAALDLGLAQNQRLPRLDTRVLDGDLVGKLLTRLREQGHQVSIGRDVEGVLGVLEKRLDCLVRLVVDRLRLAAVEHDHAGLGGCDSHAAVASLRSWRQLSPKRTDAWV